MLLHLALKLAQDTANEDGITYVFDVLANVALERGHTAKAERLFKDVMQRQLRNGKTDKESNEVRNQLLSTCSLKRSWTYFVRAILPKNVVGEVDDGLYEPVPHRFEFSSLPILLNFNNLWRTICFLF